VEQLNSIQHKNRGAGYGPQFINVLHLHYTFLSSDDQ